MALDLSSRQQGVIEHRTGAICYLVITHHSRTHVSQQTAFVRYTKNTTKNEY